jgi:hypothetical protein
MRFRLPIAALVLASAALGCGVRNIPQFPGKAIDNRGNTLTRHQLSDQGSGNADSPAGYRVQRTTVGGTYARQIGVAGSSYKVSPGLHGNPRATQ